MSTLPQSLPSFAQAFSSSSLSEIAPISNALPPIQARPAPSPPRTTVPTKKRSREDHLPPRSDRAPVDARNPDAPRQSPPVVRVKEEDRDDVQRPPQSPPRHAPLDRDSATPGVQPLSKKRRVTVSGTSIRSSAEQGTPIPVSPVVPALPAPDDPVPRPILVKQPPPKALVDQRRGSISAVMSATGPSPMVSASLLSRSPPGDQLATSKLARIGRISPSTIPVVNRCAGNQVASGTQATTSSARPLTPPPALTSAESVSKPQQVAAAHSLPPPPISFARRRAAQPGGRKKKPADILISPRGAGPSDPLAPVIQSAPPVADPGRFPMAIPRLPLVLNNIQSTRRVASNVPPTPTRFSLQGTAATSITSTARAMPSPPNPSVPIANTLVPPTPRALQHPGYMGDKSAFLAPFEVFYDALNDSKQLKGWLSDQLQKASALIVSLKQQQEKMDEMVEDLVEKRTRVMREEITMLHQRMASLEEALLAVRAEASARGQDGAGHGYPQGGKYQNGVETPSSYRFPAPEQEHQPSSSPPIEVTRRPSLTARPEPTPSLHGSFGLGGHNRVASGAQGAAKGTPPARPQGVPERAPPSGRQAESRPAGGRSYWNSSVSAVEGQTTSRGGDKT